MASDSGDTIGEPKGKCKTSYLVTPFEDSELVIGVVGAVGTRLSHVVDVIENRLKAAGYSVERIRVSRDVIPEIHATPDSTDEQNEYARISSMMDAGDDARKGSGDNSILALGIAAKIASERPQDTARKQAQFINRRAYIVNSLKHPEEVSRLREIYPQGFYLVGVHADTHRRREYLEKDKRINPKQAEELMQRDEHEHLTHGQRVTDTFHMSDFFVRDDGQEDRLKNSLWRILDILFGHPFHTPTFDEYAMFLAFVASLRSADLSRQVGAVIAKNDEVLSTGANDCPRSGGGLYWPEYNEKTFQIEDADDGRDYKRGADSNKVEQLRIVEDIIRKGRELDVEEEKLRAALQASRIQDLTEYGRVVHAEMEALLSCARNTLSTRGASLYSTTFPCHNCAKHIIAAGITRVVYIEPYPKSKTAEFHNDSITLGFSEEETTVHFEPFVGVGPRRFFDLFSMKLSSGYTVTRKGPDGQSVKWKPEGSRLRIQMLLCSYLDLELLASALFRRYQGQKEVKNEY